MTPLFRAPADVKVADWRASAASEAKANTLGQSSRAASSFITPAYSRHAVGWTVQQREARASPRQDRFLLARFCFERKGATIPPPHMWLLLPLLCQGHVAICGFQRVHGMRAGAVPVMAWRELQRRRMCAHAYTVAAARTSSDRPVECPVVPRYDHERQGLDVCRSRLA